MYFPEKFYKILYTILLILALVCLISFLFINNSLSVSAESIKPYMINFWGNSSIPFASSVSANGSKNGVIQVYTPISLQQYHGGQNPRYLTIEVCATISADFEIYNTNTDLNYINEDITVTSVRKNCDNGYSSTNSLFYTIQTTIGKWQVGLNAGNTSVALASAYFKLTNKNSYTGKFRITNVTLSYDDNIGNTYQENVIMNNTDKIAEDTGGILNTIKSVLTGITNLPSLIWNSIKGGFTSVVNAVTSVVNKITDLFDFFSNDDNPNMSGLENSAGWLPAGPVDSLINLPLSLLDNISSNLSNTCQPVTLLLPYVDEELILPCQSQFYEDIGAKSLIDNIGLIASAFILFTYLINLYAYVDKTLTFRENNYMDNWGGI